MATTTPRSDAFWRLYNAIASYEIASGVQQEKTATFALAEAAMDYYFVLLREAPDGDAQG